MKSEDEELSRKELLLELEIAELYYEIVKRAPDLKAMNFYKNKILKEGKTIDWAKIKINYFYEKNSEKVKTDDFEDF